MRTDEFAVPGGQKTLVTTDEKSGELGQISFPSERDQSALYKSKNINDEIFYLLKGKLSRGGKGGKEAGADISRLQRSKFPPNPH